MGNLQLERTDHINRRKPIFEHTRKRKGSLSPRPLSQRFDTVKHRHGIADDRSSDEIDTFRNYRKTQDTSTMQASKERGRIANFNEFMMQVKKQLHDHSTQEDPSSSLSKSEENSRKQLVLKLKLENERMELDKYKRIVEKQLSKNHSIESIRLEGREQKRLIIQYEMDRKRNNQKVVVRDRIEGQKNKYQQKFQRAQQKYHSLAQNMKALQQLFDSCQEKLYEEEQNQKERQAYLQQQIRRSPLANKAPVFNNIPSQRMDKISNMIQGLGKLCTNMNPLEQQIKNALKTSNFDSVSSCSGPSQNM